MIRAAQIQHDFGLGDSAAGLLVTSPYESLAAEELRGQSHYIRRAFKRLRLDAILCLDGVPTIYLKQYARPVGRKVINELQRKFWNQGTGTLLVVLDPSMLYVFSSMMLPSADEAGAVDDHPALVERLKRVANTLEACQFVTRVASGQYYRDHPDRFKLSNTVDRFLLDNLSAVGDELRHDETPAERRRVHAFIGRIIFTCYLVDRAIIELQDLSFVQKKNVRTLLELLSSYKTEEARNVLYKLFRQLRVDFNGSMFEDDLELEESSLTDDEIVTLIQFLRGDEVRTGQRSLGFWAYDFSVIPVETISAIYEKFLEEEDVAEREKRGAFYTPRHLAEMVVDEATSGLDSLLGKRCLDPACGSGIFLVILFNRIAEEIERQNPRVHQRTRINELLDVLEHQICGVDVNKTACRIACFSLYIAFLDQFHPRVLKELQRKSDKLLPKLLAYKEDNYENTDTPVIYEGNFFDPQLPIRDDFDVVVGNPPWVGRNQTADAEVARWVESKDDNPFLADAPRARAKRKAIFLPQNAIVHAFMWKTLLHANDEGCISLLLPVQVLLNKTDDFQHAWFTTANVKRVFNLSDYRWFLFPGADRPATIIHFRPPTSTKRVSTVEYIVPKVRQQDPRSGLIRVFPEDRKWVRTEDILRASRPSNQPDDNNAPAGPSVLWKALLWGSPRDMAFLDYLRQLECLDDIAGDRRQNKRWLKGTGFQPWYEASYERDPEYGEKEPIPGELDDPFVATIDNLQMFVLPHDTTTLGAHLRRSHCPRRDANTPSKNLAAALDGFHRARDERLYGPPVVLISKGFTKFVYSDFKIFYRDSLTGITATRADEDLLRFLVVLVRSPLAKYFMFHTAGHLGTERDQVFVYELMRLPFPLPDSPDSHKDAELIVEEIAHKMKNLQSSVAGEYAIATHSADFELRSQLITESRQQRVEQLQTELEPLVYRYFKLTSEEIALIEDTCDVIKASATPNTPDKVIPTTRPTVLNEREQYSRLLCRLLNKWSKADQAKGHNQPFFFHAEVTPLREVGMTLLTIHQAKEPTSPVESSANGQLENVVARLTESTSYTRGSFEYLRGVIFGDGNKIHVLKPDMLGQWTRTAALNDADRVFDAIVLAKRK